MDRFIVLRDDELKKLVLSDTVELDIDGTKYLLCSQDGYKRCNEEWYDVNHMWSNRKEAYVYSARCPHCNCNNYGVYDGLNLTSMLDNKECENCGKKIRYIIHHTWEKEKENG